MHCFTVAEVAIHSSQLFLALLSFNYSLVIIKKGFILLNNPKEKSQGKTSRKNRNHFKVHLKDPVRSKIDAEQQMPIGHIYTQPFFFNILSFNRNAPLYCL